MWHYTVHELNQVSTVLFSLAVSLVHTQLYISCRQTKTVMFDIEEVILVRSLANSVLSVQHEGLVSHSCIPCASRNYSKWLLKAYSQYKCHQNIGINVLASLHACERRAWSCYLSRPMNASSEFPGLSLPNSGEGRLAQTLPLAHGAVGRTATPLALAGRSFTT